MALTRGRKAAILAGLVVFIVGASTAGSYALWSVNGTISGSASAGTIGISANGSATTALTGLTNAQMGPSVTQTVPLTITNTSSTLPMTYSTTLTNTETPSTSVIGDNITYVIWVSTATSKCVTGAAVASPSWTGTLASGSTTVNTGRPLAISGSEILCVRTTMSASAPASVQGQSVASTLTFTGSST